MPKQNNKQGGEKIEKIVALYSGGDWYDATCDHIVLIKDIDLAKEEKVYKKWYEKEYVPNIDTAVFYTFKEWLIKKGFAKIAKPDDVIEYWED